MRHISPNYSEGISAYDPVTQTSFYVEGTADNGAINVNAVVAGQLINVDYDYVAATYPDATTEIYTFKAGGSDGTTVATITVVYTDASKANLSTVTKV